jgi:restriction system protein
VPCSIALRTAAIAFDADLAGNIEAVCFNGEISFVDPADGHRKRQVVVSVVLKRGDINAIKLDSVDPVAALKAQKGRLSVNFEEFAPVNPIMRLNTNDSRTIDSELDLGTFDSSTNLAAMDWEEFEVLVREVFAKEFSGDEMEVKVTQASRDGGVDAIAWDPDPIRGGKFVFQAKRYTNTVDVSAVRDLYGVIMHEGANRGILVTTSSYGPDAYKFAEGKPITLIDGSQLLELLKKQGYSMRIDLIEAKKLLSD